MRILLLTFLLACEPPRDPDQAPIPELPEPLEHAPPSPADAAPDPADAAAEEADNDLIRANPNADLPPLPKGAPARIAARHLLIAWSGTVGANAALRRTRAEAFAQIQAIEARMNAGEPLAQLAIELSDGPSGPRGGNLGAFARGAMHADFERAAFALEVAKQSSVVETPFGFHLIERVPLVEVRVAHVLVQWAGLRDATTTRTEAEAKLRAGEARHRLLSGEDVASVAAALSDGPTAARGGDLGFFQRGQLSPVFEDAAFALQRGEVSPIVASPIGLHIIQRLE